MTRLRSVDTSKWPEVSCINSYAVFMGHLAMGVRGLGFLVFTWTSVVLLGGFVSTLQKKDFWCLTAITLVQVAGVFDSFLKEKLVNIRYAYRGLVSSVELTVLTEAGDLTGLVTVSIGELYDIFFGDERSRCSRWLHNVAVFCKLVWYGLRAFYGVLVQVVVAAVQAMVFAIILCPLATLYMVGLYISAALSLWRLVERDYIVIGDAAADAVDPSKANLKSALDVIYSIALAQGILFCYKTIFSLSERKIMEHVASNYKFSDLARDPLLDYLEETRMGCEKDVTFRRGRNLITYAVDLMESKSPDRYISGTRILDALIGLQAPSSRSKDSQLLEQHRLMKQLLTAGNIIHKLVQTLSLRGPYDRETRVCAARILAHVAGEIHLEELPRGMQCIASLLVTFQEYLSMETYERDWQLERHGKLLVLGYEDPTDRTTHEGDAGGYKQLVLLGLHILGKLTADEHNCRVMSRDTDGGLVAMITAPVSSKGFHDDHHEEWASIADGLLQLIHQLMAAPAKSHEEEKLQLQIRSSNQAINTVESILKCPQCYSLYKQAVEILLIDIHVDTSSILAASESRENFIRGLLSIFVDQEKQSSITELTGQMLVDMLSSEGENNDKIILDQDHKLSDSGGNLTASLVNAKSSVSRIHAADILKHLCSHYTNDDELLNYLKKAMIDSIKKVLKAILPEESNGEKIQAVTEESNTKFSEPDMDVEAQNCGLSSQDTDQQNNNSASSNREQNGEQISEAMKLQEALLSLCDKICGTWISADPDFGRKLDLKAAKFCSKQKKPVRAFASLVKEAQERLDKKKAQELPATNVSASSSTTAT
ncbi:hypothetical protein E2562_022842 [Oryza meyeriana var. granulata]|uniref:DUF4220 domain-containing protein n=1 Tax=Oryza meyeriana var. granulata TaxID=110450 RepID=A0A6G1BN73_9ORYZ|nr:hypothetical protein E2562_022842 [Oryza meyeriana var. granulata]